MEGRYYSERCPIWSTALYVLLFPAVLWMALFWWAATEPCSVWDFLTLFTWSWIPISIPVSVYFMWSRYFKGQYEKIHDFRMLPLLAMAAFIIANFIIDGLERFYG